MRDYNTLTHLRWALDKIDIHEQDVVVMSARVSRFGAFAYDLVPEQIFSDYEQTLFTRAVSVAESFGKKGLFIGRSRGRCMVRHRANGAKSLDSSAVVIGVSSKMSPEEQAFALGRAWESLSLNPSANSCFRSFTPKGNLDTFRIGPHTPAINTEDIYLTHRLWLRATHEHGLPGLHHSDIVSLALERLARDFSQNPEEVLQALRDNKNETGAAHASSSAVENHSPDAPSSPHPQS